MNRSENLTALKPKPGVLALIVGGGINGIGTFRDLALNGVDVLLVEKRDRLLGRTLIAMLGRVTREMVEELTQVRGHVLGRNDQQNAAEAARSLFILVDRYEVRL